MTLAKAVVSGTVFRAPEKRYTQNDVAVYGLTLNIDEREEIIHIYADQNLIFPDTYTIHQLAESIVFCIFLIFRNRRIFRCRY